MFCYCSACCSGAASNLQDGVTNVTGAITPGPVYFIGCLWEKYFSLAGVVTLWKLQTFSVGRLCLRHCLLTIPRGRRDYGSNRKLPGVDDLTSGQMSRYQLEKCFR